jgi:hypothetical protein
MKIDEDIAEIIGMHIGDGCISVNKRYSEYYLGGDLIEEREYHDKWVTPLFNKKIMIPLYNKKVNYKEHPKVGIYGFHIFDKKIVELFKSFGITSGSKINIRIPLKIRKNKGLYKRFLRGLFDTDGTIYFNKNTSKKKPINNQPVIKLGTVSKELCLQILDLLKKEGLHPRLKKPYKGKKDKNKVYTVVIYRRGDINFFINNIGFKNPKHYTKWRIYKKFGFCPSKTTIKKRYEILKKKSL